MRIASSDGKAVESTLFGPTSFQRNNLLVADLLKDVELTLHKRTSTTGSNSRVEVSVGVGAGDLDIGANERGNVLSLPDVQGFGDGVRALVAT